MDLNLARLPMNRALAALGGEAILERRETDPDEINFIGRRKGTVRSLRRAYALGMRAYSPASHGHTRKKVSISADGTLSFSIYVGDVLVAGEYPILCLSNGDGSLNDSHQIILARVGSVLGLQMRSTDNAGNVTTSVGFAVTARSRVHLVWRINTTAETMALNAGGDSAGTDSLNYAGLAGTFSNAYYIQALGADAYTAKVDVDPPRIDNLSFIPSYYGTPADLLGVRGAGSPTLVFDLSQAAEATQSTGSDTSNWFFRHPAAPALAGGKLRLGGRSGSFRIKHNPELERFWSTELRSVAETEFCFIIKGTRNRVAAGEQYLVDYGDLIKLKITAADFAEFTYNGLTLTTDGVNDIGDGEDFTIICGRDGYTLFLRLAVGANDQTKSSTSTSIDPPRYGFERERDLYIGSQEDPSLGSRFSGDIDLAAFYPLAYRVEPPNKDGALFYYTFTDQVDDSIRGAVGAAITHSERSGPPDFAPAAIQDSPFKVLASGLAIAASGPSGMTGGIAGSFSSDSVSTRFGDLAVVCSGGKAAIADVNRGVTAPFGVPEIGERVAVGSIGAGPLVGARGYAIRLLSYNGSYGPWSRLQAVLLDNEKAIIGSSSETGDDLESELGETYGRTMVGGESRFRFPFAAGALADGTYPIEVEMRVPAMDEDVKEDIFHRGAVRLNGSAGPPAFFSCGINASFDPNTNWCAQRAFRYKAPATTSYREGFGIFGFGKKDPGNQNAYNQDFVAYITTEGWGAARPRLVVGISRSNHRVSWVNANWFLHANYKLCTFTNDATSTAGGDFWLPDNDYNVIMQREGSALKVYVHDRTRDIWTTLTARSMTGLPSADIGGVSGTVPATANPYSADDVFTGWRAFSDNRQLTFGSAGFNSIEVPDIDAAGAIDTGNYYLDYLALTWVPSNGMMRGSPGNMPHYHSRFWNRSYPLSTLKLYSEERYAAQGGQSAINQGNIADIAHIVEDNSSQPSSFYDRRGRVPFKCYDTSGSGVAFIGFTQTNAALQPIEAPIALFGANGTALASIPVALYMTELGNGQLVLRVGTEGSFVITEDIWSEASANPSSIQRRRDLNISAWTEFKRIAFGLNLVTAGGNTTFTVEGMAVNATTIFELAIGGGTTMATASYAGGWIHVAGLATTGNCLMSTEVAEFRFWNTGFGPDVQGNSGFEYQSGRVATTDLPNLKVYAKFQPRDEYNAGAGLATLADQLYDYGTLGGINNEWSILGGGGFRAEIFDTRTDTVVGDDDPQPLIAFPASPRHDIVAIEVAATRLIPVANFDDTDETQEALLSARLAPLYELATVPIGATHYIDSASDGVLGFEVDERDGYLPPAIRQLFPWQDHLCAVGDEGELWVSTPGPGGWASFPAHLRHRVDFGDEPDTLTAGGSIGGVAILFGRGTTLMIGGAPTSPQPGFISRLGGAYSPRCVASDGRNIYSYNGRLWRVSMGQPTKGPGLEDFGLPVEDLLPDPSVARLEFSESLSSLLLINESTGVVLRFSFKRGDWSVEDRDAVSMGELTSGYGLITRGGAYAESSESVYADDVDLVTPTTLAGTKSGSGITFLAVGGLQIGQRHTIQGGSTYISARVVSVVGFVVTYDSLAGVSDGAVTVYPGAPSEGLLVDTGDMRQAQDRGFMESVRASLTTGAAQLGVDGYSVTGDRVSRSDLVWDTLADGTNGVGLSGSFLRAAIRSHEPVALKLGSLEATILP